MKFYTSEGNYDMVGSNTPVFFVRDPTKFQHFIRSQKRSTDNGVRDNDMQWDFWTLSPEPAHPVMWLMRDREILKNWQRMNAYSSHAYMWVNAKGERFLVKYHYMTDQGIDFLTQQKADRMAGNDKQMPVNRLLAPVYSFSKDGVMRVQNVSDPVYASNSKGGPQADGERIAKGVNDG